MNTCPNLQSKQPFSSKSTSFRTRLTFLLQRLSMRKVLSMITNEFQYIQMLLMVAILKSRSVLTFVVPNLYLKIERLQYIYPYFSPALLF